MKSKHTLLQAEVYPTLTGFFLAEVVAFAIEIDVEMRDLTIALMVIHSNLTASVAAVIATALGWDVGESTCDKILRDVADAAWALPKTYRPETRFEYVEPDFPACFSIVDGIPCYCRADASYYNDKNHSKTVVFQVVVNLAGAPFAWSAGVEGSRTDAFAFDKWDAFPHHQREFILADSMYSASAHCVTSWKKNYVDKSFTDDEKSTYEMHFRRVRSRVEHFFARLNRHAWVSGARQSPATVRKIFNL